MIVIMILRERRGYLEGGVQGIVRGPKNLINGVLSAATEERRILVANILSADWNWRFL
jgi:hypothetical protein